MFQWYDCLAALFVPSVGTTNIMVKVEALTNFTEQTLLDSTKAITAKYRHETDSQQVLIVEREKGKLKRTLKREFKRA